MMTTSALKSYEADVNAIQLVSTLCLFCAFVIPVSDLPFNDHFVESHAYQTP